MLLSSRKQAKLALGRRRLVLMAVQVDDSKRRTFLLRTLRLGAAPAPPVAS